MSFNSFEYLSLLGVSFFLFWMLRNRGASRLWVLLFASYTFYAAWNGYYLLLIIASTLIDYCAGQLIHDNDQLPTFRKAMLAISVASNLAVLGFFKYGQFTVDNAVSLMTVVGFDIEAPTLRILLPVGISFYTFQSMSYTFDIYLRKIKPVERARDFFLFVAFFPQLVAGPIVRASELLPQFGMQQKLDRDDFGDGAWRILRGLIKKMVIADYLAATVVDPIFNMPHLFGSLELFIALWGFLAQIYCDFSGYTDIALGSARIFGFRLPENFDMPFAASTPAAFWRRWHMTLTRFAFDYLYIPLGGNRGGEGKTVRNVLITFAAIGLWHGAEWKFVFFGLYHAVGVIGSRYWLKATAAVTGSKWEDVETLLTRLIVPVILTNLFVVFSMPLFRADDLTIAWTIYTRIFSLSGFTLGFTTLALLVLGGATALHFIPDHWENKGIGGFARLKPVFQGALITILALGIAQAVAFARKSFIYFQF